MSSPSSLPLLSRRRYARTGTQLAAGALATVSAGVAFSPVLRAAESTSAPQPTLARPTDPELLRSKVCAARIPACLSTDTARTDALPPCIARSSRSTTRPPSPQSSSRSSRRCRTRSQPLASPRPKRTRPSRTRPQTHGKHGSAWRSRERVSPLNQRVLLAQKSRRVRLRTLRSRPGSHSPRSS